MVINPNRAMTMEDFAQIYSANPNEAASNMWMNAPSEARSYVQNQWNKFGTGAADPETFFRRQGVANQMQQIAAMPRNAEGYPIAANRTFEGYAIPAATAATGKIATLQNGRDTVTPDDYVAAPLPYGQSDPELLKAQLARGGNDALAILREHNQGRMFQPKQLATGGFDYSGYNPIKAPDDLLSNKAFIRLSGVAPDKAAKLYRDLTGKDFSKDLAERTKQQAALESDYREGYRSGIIKGDVRRGSHGLLERKVQIPDPKNPLGPKIESWEVAEPEFQAGDTKYWSAATGQPMTTPNVMDHIPPQHRLAFTESLKANLRGGMAPREAMEAAVKSIPSTATMASPSPTAAPVAARPAMPPPPASAGQAAYNEWAQQQAADRFSSETGESWGENLAGIVSQGAGTMGRIATNMAQGIPNWINAGATAIGASAPFNWQRPMAPGESVGGPSPLTPPPTFVRPPATREELIQMLLRQR